MISVSEPRLLFERNQLYHIGKPTVPAIAEVIVIYPGLSTISTDEQTQLQKILSACKITKEQAAMYGAEVQRISLAELASRYNCKRVLIFGDVELGVNINLPKGKTTICGDWMLLKTDSLQKMLTAKPQEKQQLWEQLKMLFSISG